MPTPPVPIKSMPVKLLVQPPTVTAAKLGLFSEALMPATNSRLPIGGVIGSVV